MYTDRGTAGTELEHWPFPTLLTTPLR